MRLPDDLRRFLLRSDGGDVWFTEEREPPGFFLSMLSARGIAELYRVRQGFSDDLDLVPFASDGASEYFYVDRVSGSILMINTTGTRAEAAVCG